MRLYRGFYGEVVSYSACFMPKLPILAIEIFIRGYFERLSVIWLQQDFIGNPVNNA